MSTKHSPQIATPCTTQLSTINGRTYAATSCSLGGWGYVPACLSGRAARCDGRDPMGR